MNTAFERTEQKEDWITPSYIVDALGVFDTDPCSSRTQKRAYAKNQYFIEDDGLKQQWEGRVWCNPPYGNKAELFIRKLADHRNGIALIFARTDTKLRHECIFKRACGILFMEGRVSFWKDGDETCKSPAGCGSCLIAFDIVNFKLLARAVEDGYLKGKLVGL